MSKEMSDPDGDGRHDHNTKSLNLPETQTKDGRVQLVYAPETGTPSPLLHIKVNGTQRCQVTINKYGLERALKIATRLYADYTEGKVELRDIYSWRNHLEGEVH